MAKHSLKLLFLRKYRTSKKYYRQLKSSTSKYTAVPIAEHDGSESHSVHNTSAAYPHQHHHPPSSSSNQGKRKGKRSTRYVNNSQVDSVDCCLLIYDCISENKLRTFVFLIIVGLVSTTGLYIHNQRLLQYSYVNDPVEETYVEDHALVKKLPPSVHRHPYLYRIYRGDVFSPSHGIRLKRCAIPELNPFASEVKRFISYYVQPPNCVHEQRGFDEVLPFSIKNGSLLVRNVDEDEVKAAGCCYRPFHRTGDGDYWSSHSCTSISKPVNPIPKDYDYIELLCTGQYTGADFRDGFALTHRKTQTEDRIKEFERLSPLQNDERLSVIILGLDATSRMNFIRAMPKSNKYLLKTLSAISLNGYTKVAENTLPNVVPLLTGRTLEEFKQQCVKEKSSAHSVHLDECPFIWNTFSENGYRTSYSEDDVDIGIFNMNWPNAFVRSPTDYYLRPYSLLMQRKHSYKNGFCYGPSLSFEKLLESIRSLAETFNREPYFQFTWSTKLSHNDFNKMRWGDEPLYNFLQYMHSGGYLNSTALLILGDHGSRLDQIRSTAQGKLEDRMPVAYFVLPDWFKTKYARAYENLKRNSKLITSAFDVHKTLHYFMNLNSLAESNLNKSNATTTAQFDDDGDVDDVLVLPNNETVALGQLRGSSLFNDIPENRSCFAAGIPLHWCVCHRKIQLAKNLTYAEDAARFVISHLNTLLKDSESCVTLKFQSVDDVSKWDPSEIIREGCDITNKNPKNLIDDEHNGNQTGIGESSAENYDCNGSLEVLVLQIAFTVAPSGATFETTVIQLDEGWWRITEDVVRTNSYEGQSDCVEQKLKPYCYCGEDESIFDDLF